jgi:hypothetical protein
VLLTYVPSPYLPNSQSARDLYLERLNSHEHVLDLLLPGSRTPLRGHDLAGEARYLHSTATAW